MKSPLLRVLLPLALALGFGGCTSSSTQVEPGHNLKAKQRFFVLSNANDNNAIDQLIASSVKATGRTAEVGPLTMMPEDAQAVITYQDHWTWDFGEHLTYLRIAVRDPLGNDAYAEAIYSVQVPSGEKLSVTVHRLVASLLEK
jgi:hypothetical protein